MRGCELEAGCGQGVEQNERAIEIDAVHVIVGAIYGGLTRAEDPASIRADASGSRAAMPI